PVHLFPPPTPTHSICTLSLHDALPISLPHTPPPGAGRPVSIRSIIGIDALRDLGSKSFYVFIASSLLICIPLAAYYAYAPIFARSEEHTSELQSRGHLVCRLLLEKKNR